MLSIGNVGQTANHHRGPDLAFFYMHAAKNPFCPHLAPLNDLNYICCARLAHKAPSLAGFFLISEFLCIYNAMAIRRVKDKGLGLN